MRRFQPIDRKSRIAANSDLNVNSGKYGNLRLEILGKFLQILSCMFKLNLSTPFLLGNISAIAWNEAGVFLLFPEQLPVAGTLSELDFGVGWAFLPV